MPNGRYTSDFLSTDGCCAKQPYWIHIGASSCSACCQFPWRC